MNIFQLPGAVLQLDHSDNGYTITSTELTTEIDKIIFNLESSALAVDVLAMTVWTMRDDISTFYPAVGFLNVDQNLFFICRRSILSTIVSRSVVREAATPADHKAFATCHYHVETVTDKR